MKGRDIIKAIIEANGLDTEYDFSEVKKKTGKKTKKTNGSITRVETDIDAGFVILYVDDPHEAFFKKSLSDCYSKYIWDGNTIWFYTNADDEISKCDIDYGYGGITFISASMKRTRDAVVDLMSAGCYEFLKKGKPIPEWMNNYVDIYLKAERRKGALV